jgi:hypothetical protein
MLLDQLSGKYGRRSSQVGVSFVVVLSPSQSRLQISICLKFWWHAGIFDDFRVKKAGKATTTAAPKHTEQIKIFVVRDIRE